ncbi:MAG: aminotransferase class V-fold PLP-dependent enzyme [Pirellulales bacterium]
MTVDAAAGSTAWRLRPDTIYLNHGSFGPPPEPVLADQRRWKTALDEQPMDFFTRQYEPAWRAARARLARWLDVPASQLIFVDNATHGMNIVAASFPLEPGDEVVLNNHEYGAVLRIWQRACAEAGAAPPRIAQLPARCTAADEVVDAIFAEVTPRTRLIVASHVTSPTAIILPIELLCRRAAVAGIACCVDGPHAPAQVDFSLSRLSCDFYVASCHKWLSAPFGSGFLAVAPRWQAVMRTPQLSWGRLLPDVPQSWDDEFIWSGTRDPSAWLAVPAAIDFLADYGFDRFRQTTHALAQYGRNRLVELTGREPLVPDDPQWYGSMAHVPLPPGNARALQRALWEQYGIEVPIVDWNQERFIRVSCHLYNDASQIDRLVAALHTLLARE